MNNTKNVKKLGEENKNSDNNTKSVKQLVEENKNRKTHKTVNIGVGTGNDLRREYFYG